MKKQIKIIVADDHPVYRAGLRQILAEEPNVNVVHEAADGAEVLATAPGLKPDIVLIDIEMPVVTGLDVARERQRRDLPFEIIFITMYREKDLFEESLDLGVKGYVLKDSVTDDIIRCIESVAAGHPYVSPSLSRYLINQRSDRKNLREKKPGLDVLTASERKILRLIASDKTSKQIADELGISPKTVDNHRSNICARLGLYGSHSLLKFAFENRNRL